MIGELILWPKPYLLLSDILLLIPPPPKGLLVCLRLCSMQYDTMWLSLAASQICTNKQVDGLHPYYVLHTCGLFLDAQNEEVLDL